MNPLPAPESVDPNLWADAILKLFNGGGWVIPGLIALYIAFKYSPWRKKGD